MRVKHVLAFLTLSVCVLSLGSASAADKLDGAYKFVSVTFQGGKQTEADAKGMIVVHGKYWSNVRSSVAAAPWTQQEPQEERQKKMLAAFQGLTAGCGTFQIEGNVVTMTHVAGANPSAIGTSSKWEYKLEGNKLTMKPQAAEGVEFVFERLP